MNIGESVILALNSVKEHKLRAILTLISIAIGVFAIIGVGSLVNSIDNMVDEQMDALGENTFFITKMPNIEFHDWRKYMKRKPITLSQVDELKKNLTSAKLITGYSATSGIKISSGLLDTDPDIRLIGSDENFFQFNMRTLSIGRPITGQDIIYKRSVAVLGNDVVVKIFPNVNPIGKRIKIKNQNFTVIGVLEPKGAIMGQSQDNMAIVPISYFLTYYSNEWSESLQLMVMARDRESLPETFDDAIGAMRSIRNLKPWEENTFEIETNESVSESFKDFTIYITIFGYVTGAIALLAAGVGIMNIMLVSVKERTREIGIRKAVGAKRRWILIQFIIEAVTLCIIGGLSGILLGLGAATLLSNFINIKLSISLPLISFGL
ncbi:MAG: hypothetical protein QG635_1029, partial [Bacteroidota bacterium]|nr:hypothetical protein [Bacteroidota bacterium]